MYFAPSFLRSPAADVARVSLSHHLTTVNRKHRRGPTTIPKKTLLVLVTPTPLFLREDKIHTVVMFFSRFDFMFADVLYRICFLRISISLLNIFLRQEQ